MEILLATDRAVFFAINHLFHNAATDLIASFFSGVGSAGIIWVIIGVFFFFREEMKDRRFFVPIVFALGVCWVFVELLLKFLFQRPRPSVMEGAIIIGNASWFSMPSSHAAISWAMAVIFSRYEPKARWIWYTLAFLISFSRIYLGMHYPSDVVAGALIGVGIGKLAFLFILPQTARTRVPRPRGIRRMR